MNKIIKEETLGQRIKEQRIRMRLTQEDLAEKMCTTKSMISYYENNHGDMKQSMIAEFARVLNTSVEYLICGRMDYVSMDEQSVEIMRLLSAMDENTKNILLIQIRALAKG